MIGIWLFWEMDQHPQLRQDHTSLLSIFYFAKSTLYGCT